ncbi:MAG: heme oxygenase [Frankiales bacterium]|nr:heme oxygenase [Frankiales bacterium]
MVMSSSRIHGASRTSDVAFSVELRRAMWSARGRRPSPPTRSARPPLALAVATRRRQELWLAQLSHLYRELDRAAQRLRTDPIAAPFAAMDLTVRRAAIESDLRELRGGDWDDQLPLLAETHAYAQRLRQVAGASAGSFVAHHYTRYLGDLSGIAIGAATPDDQPAAKPDLLSAPGRRFVTGQAVEDPDARKREYRRQLDTAPWSALDKQLITAEASHAHRLNAALLGAVERAAFAPASRRAEA